MTDGNQVVSSSPIPDFHALMIPMYSYITQTHRGFHRNGSYPVFKEKDMDHSKTNVSIASGGGAPQNFCSPPQTLASIVPPMLQDILIASGI